jgi:hypothetical protein
LEACILDKRLGIDIIGTRLGKLRSRLRFLEAVLSLQTGGGTPCRKGGFLGEQLSGGQVPRLRTEEVISQ